MRKTIVYVFMITLLSGMITSNVEAQCAMCKSAKQKNEKGLGKGLNSGIVYLMSIPYLAVGTLGILWYRNSRKEKVAQS